MRLTDLPTPSLVLDRARLHRNAQRMQQRAQTLGVRLRPHLKTAKSVEVARMAISEADAGLTIATLNEAEHFAAAGFQDLIYAVCMTPDKLPRVRALADRGVPLGIITEDPGVARQIAAGPATRAPLRVLVEIDSGEHRTGVDPHSPELLTIAHTIHASPHVVLAGVLTHAGHSYRCRDPEAIAAIADDERDLAVLAADRLRAANLPCPIVSVGSTPTATFARNLDGVTEMRPGVYLFGDLFQAAIGSCAIDDLAVSVLATVMSHSPSRNTLMIDAGGLALSKDRATASTAHDAGYGRLIDVRSGALLSDLWVADVHQEHGEVHSQAPLPYDALPIGSRVRVLPNHVCMTAAMYPEYAVVEGDDRVQDRWARTNGWGPARGFADETRTR